MILMIFFLIMIVFWQNVFAGELIPLVQPEVNDGVASTLKNCLQHVTKFPIGMVIKENIVPVLTCTVSCFVINYNKKKIKKYSGDRFYNFLIVSFFPISSSVANIKNIMFFPCVICRHTLQFLQKSINTKQPSLHDASFSFLKSIYTGLQYSLFLHTALTEYITKKLYSLSDKDQTGKGLLKTNKNFFLLYGFMPVLCMISSIWYTFLIYNIRSLSRLRQKLPSTNVVTFFYRYVTMKLKERGVKSKLTKNSVID